MARKSIVKKNAGKTRTILILAVFLSCLFVINIKSQTKKDENPMVTLCQLNKSPNDYDGKTVKISALYVGTFEGSDLVDKSCGKSENWVEFVAVCKTESDTGFLNKYKADCKTFYKELFQNIKGDPIDGQFVNVVVIGTVEVRNIPKNMNMHNIALNVLTIEKTSSVKDKLVKGTLKKKLNKD